MGSARCSLAAVMNFVDDRHRFQSTFCSVDVFFSSISLRNTPVHQSLQPKFSSFCDRMDFSVSFSETTHVR